MMAKSESADKMSTTMEVFQKPVLKRNDYFDSRKIFVAEQDSITNQTLESYPTIKSSTESQFYFQRIPQSNKRRIPPLDFTQIRIVHIRNSIIDLKKDVQNKSFSKNSLEIRKNEILKALQSIHTKNSQFKKELQNLQEQITYLDIEKNRFNNMCCFLTLQSFYFYH